MTHPPPPSHPSHALQPAWIAAMALIAFLAMGLMTPSSVMPVLTPLHIILGVGLFPLILSGMIYFTAPLTRTAPAKGFVTWIPFLALAAGITGSLAFIWIHHLLYPAALLGLTAAVGLIFWITLRAKQAVGDPHPGLRWYQAALFSLILSLLSLLLPLWSPEQWPMIRTFHLHLNLLGFVGLTAIGTLQTLLPTTAGYRDPQTSERLYTDLKYAFFGALLSAVGAAWDFPVAWIGLALWAYPLGRFLLTVIRARAWSVRGASAALTGALIGFFLTLIYGGLHTAGWLDTRGASLFFFVVFLFPLVTGAMTHLLPLWLYPGAQQKRQAAAQQILAQGAVVRTLIFLYAGLSIAAGIDDGLYLALAVLLVFIAQVIRMALLCRTRFPTA